MSLDLPTANAFANSWNNLPAGSVYTLDQIEDWLAPIGKNDLCGKRVLELGCGNGSLMVHLLQWEPTKIEGVDLGDSVRSAVSNLASFPSEQWAIHQADLTTYQSTTPFDIVFSIGVLHHLKHPTEGFNAVLRNVCSGGLFHCWVYAWEGNSVIRRLVDPLRVITSKLPWWITKYLFASPLVAVYFIYAKLIAHCFSANKYNYLPLHAYSQWIAKREFAFFRHVAFDQLVTPQTTYIHKSTIQTWLKDHPDVDQTSTYVIFRNGNSWKFGGRKKLIS
jgi:SAM-dependent methyltransferase